jgi:hypothetical protein
MKSSPASLLTERDKATVNTEAYPLRNYPAVSPISDTKSPAPPMCQDVPEHNATPCSFKYQPLVWILKTRTRMAIFGSVGGFIIIGIWGTLMMLPSILSEHGVDGLVNHSTATAIAGRIHENHLSKKYSIVKQASLTRRGITGDRPFDDGMIWILLSGIGIALLCGVSFSWYIERKMVGPRVGDDGRVIIKRAKWSGHV